MSSVKPPKVFVSATSGDLRSVRAVVKEALLKIGCMPIEQADFPPDYRTVADFLTNQIEACDAIVHIAGKRYGAEPNPDSLPPGTARRSYTQLEYDVAKRLKKKVFTFICGDDFPYDQCDAEPEGKVLLQQVHRAALFDGNDKYEPISTGDQCAERIKHLRLQLEELARELAAERRQQRIAWSAVAAALVAILVISIGIWYVVRGTREDTTQIVNNTNELKNTTSNIQKTSNEIKREVTESSAVQRDTAAKVISIDKSVQALVESDLLTSIAQKAEIDPLQVKQLVLQAQAAGADTLAFAKQLSGEGRHEDAYGLARFVAETALLRENANYFAAAAAFLIAAEEKGKIMLSPDTMAMAHAKYSEMEQLALRGQDAWRTLPSNEQIAHESTFIELSFTRGFALSQMMVLGEPNQALSTIDKAIFQIDGALARKPTDKAVLAKLRRRRALYMAHKAKWTPVVEATKLTSDSLVEAGRAVALANEAATVSDRVLALNTRAAVGLLTYDLQSQMAARKTLKGVQDDCREGLSLPIDESIEDVRCELAAYLGRASLELSERALSTAERTKVLADAIEQLTVALGESQANKQQYAGRLAAMGLLRAYCLKNRGQHDVGSEREVEAASETANAYGLNDDDRIILAEFAITLTAIKGNDDATDLKAAAEMLEQTLAKYPWAVSPRMYCKINVTLARVWLAKSKVQRFSLRDGIPEQDVMNGCRFLGSVVAQSPRNLVPHVLAEAYWEWGRALSEGIFRKEKAVEELNRALAIVTREEDPELWANVNRQLGIALVKSDPTQREEALVALRNAFLVHNEKAFPDRFRSDCHAIASAYVETALSANDDPTKQYLRSQSLKFAVAASISERTASTNGNFFTQKLELLTSELKASLSPEEQKKIDDEIERLKNAFTQNGIDPLK